MLKHENKCHCFKCKPLSIRGIKKICTKCNKEYISRSGSRKVCNECEKELSICEFCGKVIENRYHKRFCSNSCKSIHANLNGNQKIVIKS